jgi:hypothetical protein
MLIRVVVGPAGVFVGCGVEMNPVGVAGETEVFWVGVVEELQATNDNPKKRAIVNVVEILFIIETSDWT